MKYKGYCFLLTLLCSVAFARIPVIIDTDMGFDDWVAILYVLKNKNLDVKAITVDCNGLTYCPQGGINAAKLASLVNKKIPVYVGRIDKKNAAYAFPSELREFSSKMAIPGVSSLAAYPIAEKPAAQAIVDLAREAAAGNQPITIMSIGTAVNLADSFAFAKTQNEFAVVKKGIARIYKAGGAFGETILTENKQRQLSNFNIQGNLGIPDFFATNNTMAEWNIYAAVGAMQDVLQSGIPITWVSINASDMARITPEAINFLEEYAKKDNALQFSLDAAKYLVAYQGGWDKIAHNFDFWDTAATIAAFNSDVVSEAYENVPVCLNDKGFQFSFPAKLPRLTEGKTLNYYFFPAIHGFYYGAVIVDETPGKNDATSICNLLKMNVRKTNVIKGINVSRFYQHFARMN
ncbi:nucleoside hydrolase [Legionella cardiaca]|uniref:Nucleoside hydrolase n=1 Tax=Legionella cardiaca TaxID=1071983 RepID=A0ABY8AV11_9GAMM|nr:nucleoside hydrolase [Legionella cardiaca]WED44524.1 nucleoside hydrolase [Legionella cardiaca]